MANEITLVMKGVSPMVTLENSVWATEVHLKTLSPARRDKLVLLLNQARFVLKDINSSDGIQINEIRDSLEGYVVGVAQ